MTPLQITATLIYSSGSLFYPESIDEINSECFFIHSLPILLNGIEVGKAGVYSYFENSNVHFNAIEATSLLTESPRWIKE